jgi:hypothetical protein
MSCVVRIKYVDGMTQTSVLSLRELSIVMKKSPMYKKRPTRPLFPWLIEYGFELSDKEFNKSGIQKIDVEEKIIT